MSNEAPLALDRTPTLPPAAAQRSSPESAASATCLCLLPVEILVQIVLGLRRKDVNALRRCSRHWRDLVDDVPQLWTELNFDKFRELHGGHFPQGGLAAIGAQPRFKYLNRLTMPNEANFLDLLNFLTELEPRLTELRGVHPGSIATLEGATALYTAAATERFFSGLEELDLHLNEGNAREALLVAGALGRLDKLRRLSLVCSTFDAFEEIAPAPGALCALDISLLESHEERPWSSLASIGRHSQLTSLSIEAYSCEFDTAAPPLADLHRLTNLRSLTLTNCPLDGDDFDPLRLLTGLEKLVIWAPLESTVNDAYRFQMTALEPLTRLRELSIHGPLRGPFDSDGLTSVLRGLTKVVFLDPGSDEFWIAFFGHEWPALRWLFGWTCSRDALHVAVWCLQSCPSLQRFECGLDVWGPEFTYDLTPGEFAVLRRVPHVVLYVGHHLRLPLASLGVFREADEEYRDHDHWWGSYPHATQLVTNSGVFIVRLRSRARLDACAVP